jgi:hypothetical protein
MENIELKTDREILIDMHSSVTAMRCMCDDHKKKIEDHASRIVKLEQSGNVIWKLIPTIVAIAAVVVAIYK